MPVTHLPGTSIALGLESSRGSWLKVLRVLGFVGVGILLLAGIAAGILSIRQFGIGLAGVVATVVAVCLVLFVLGRYFFYRFVRPSRRVPRWPTPGARVGVVGPEARLRMLLAAPPLEDEAFEPVVLKLGPPWFVEPAVTATAGAATLTLLLITQPKGKAAIWMIVIGLVTSQIVAAGVFNAFPRYARLVPGRLDILQGSFLGRRLRLRHSYDLRTPAVLVDLNDRCLLLVHPGGRTQAVHLPSEKERAALVPEILRAAISTAQAAPLPDDALVG